PWRSLTLCYMCREACAGAAGRQGYAPAVGLSRPDELRPRERVRAAVSEPEANAGGGGEGGRVEEAERKPILHVGPEGAEIAVEALGEFIVGDEGEGALPTAAAAALGAGAAGVGAGGEAVLVVAVEGGHQIELRRGRIFHPAPEHREDLVVVVGGVGANGDHIAADGEGADRERAVGIGELDVLIAGKERRSPAEPERPHHRVTGVVGDSGPEGVTRRIPQGRERGYLRGSEWGGGDGVVLLGVVRIDGEPCELEPQLQLRGGVCGATGARELVQGPQMQRVELARVLQRLVEPPILGDPAAGGGAGEPDEREGIRRPQGIVLADAVGEGGHVAPEG